ncbi:MAG: hypothetical protein VKQ33_05510 [Candidatus Sericytochromatia bacterium]|nr:hypothetical protein [Candidatus Sericytochromatia bacterium]
MTGGPPAASSFGRWDGERSQAFVRSRKVMQVLPPHSGEVVRVALSPSERYLACAMKDGTLRLWDRSEARVVGVLAEHSAPITSMAFSPDERYLVAVSGRGDPVLWEVPTRWVHRFADPRPARATAVAFNCRDGSLAIGHRDGRVTVWDAESLRCLKTIQAHASRVCAIAIDPCGPHLASAGANPLVRMWDLRTGKQLHEFGEHQTAIVELGFSPDGRRLLSRDAGHTVKVWGPSQPTSLVTLRGDGTPLRTVAFGLAGASVATAGDGSVMNLWDVETGALLCEREVEGGWDRTHLVQNRRDGTMVACGEEGGQLVVFDCHGYWTQVSDRWQVAAWSILPYRELDALGITHTPEAGFTLVARDGERLALFAFESAVSRGKLPLPATARLRVAVSKGGRVALCGQLDHGRGLRVELVRVLDGKAASEVLSLADAFSDPSRIALDDTGTLLAVAGRNSAGGGLQLWNVETAEKVASWQFGEAPFLRIGNLRFSPDGRWLAASTSRDGVFVWDLETLGCLHVLKALARGVTALAFSPCGARLAVASADLVVRIVAVSSGGGEVQRALCGHCAPINALAFTPDGWCLASAADDHTIRFWDLKSGDQLACQVGHEGAVRHLALDHVGVRFASFDATCQANCGWNVIAAVLPQPWGPHHTSDHPEQRWLAGAKHDGIIVDLAWSPEGGRLATASWDGSAKVWEVGMNVALWTFTGHNREITGVAFSPDGKHLATSSVDGTLKARPLFGEPHARTLTCRGHAVGLSAVAFDPRGKWLASAGQDGTVMVWEAGAGGLLRTLNGHESWVRDIACSADGRSIATASRDGTAKVWDARTGQLIWTLRGHEGWVNGVAFSPDGRWLLTAGDDEAVVLWALRDGQAQRRFRGYSGVVDAVAFSPDGRRLASAGEDGLVRVWDAASGDLLRLLDGPGGWLHCLAFSPDGHWLAAAGAVNCVVLWDVACRWDRVRLEDYP